MHRLTAHITATALLLVGLPILFAGCGSSEKEDSSKDETGTVQSLKIGAMPSMDILPFLVAQKVGAYDSLGLNLEVVKFYSANDRDAALQSGNVDGTVIDYTGAMMQQAAGIPLRLVMKLDGYFHMIARPGFGGEDLAALKGTKIGVSSNTVIEYATDMMLRRVGLSDKDVTKVEVNKIPLRMEMLRGGKIDASVLPDPFITITTAGGMRTLASTREMGIRVTGLILSTQAVDEKKEAARLLLQGYDLGVDYILSHPVSDIKEILEKDLGFPPELVEQVALPKYTHKEKPAQTDLDATLDWLLSKGLVPESYKADSLLADL